MYYDVTCMLLGCSSSVLLSEAFLFFPQKLCHYPFLPFKISLFCAFLTSCFSMLCLFLLLFGSYSFWQFFCCQGLIQIPGSYKFLMIKFQQLFVVVIQLTWVSIITFFWGGGRRFFVRGYTIDYFFSLYYDSMTMVVVEPRSF